jgi:hypothetical protein
MNTIINCALDCTLIGIIIYVAIIGIVASRKMDGIIYKLDKILTNKTKQK